MSETFDPIEQFQMIGQNEINHFHLLQVNNVDWEQVLPYIPFQKWRMLLSNRFEFQEQYQDILTSEEKEQVECINTELYGDSKDQLIGSNDNNDPLIGGNDNNDQLVGGNDTTTN